MDRTFSRDFAKIAVHKTIRQGRKKGDPTTVIEIRSLRYAPDGEILYKLNFDSEWEDLPKTRNKGDPASTRSPPPLYHSALKITTSKFLDLEPQTSNTP